ncbi:hypothetical protein KIL84_005418 [Mauremys mutica]|uniref:Uncharacterized protein n=1 Tax=Mauremys mutica TaxID=74926 RepID=A0A9D4AYX2_9SAUR|nr:hypothetical protein KIL84_005418 [Mauremys mutica]
MVTDRAGEDIGTGRERGIDRHTPESWHPLTDQASVCSCVLISEKVSWHPRTDITFWGMTNASEHLASENQGSRLPQIPELWAHLHHPFEHRHILRGYIYPFASCSETVLHPLGKEGATELDALCGHVPCFLIIA